jgi:hypothetical protein
MSENDHQEVISSLSSDHGTVFFSWEFFEFPTYERSRNWYIWTGLGVAALLLYAVIAANLLFGMIVALSVLTVVMLQRNNREVLVQITEEGVMVGNRFYGYGVIKNFFIIYNPPFTKTLYLEPGALTSPRIPIPLHDQNPVTVRETLLKYLVEDIEQDDEPLSDKLSRLFKW